MGTTVKDLVVSARAKLAAVATSRHPVVTADPAVITTYQGGSGIFTPSLFVPAITFTWQIDDTTKAVVFASGNYTPAQFAAVINAAFAPLTPAAMVLHGAGPNYDLTMTGVTLAKIVGDNSAFPGFPNTYANTFYTGAAAPDVMPLSDAGVAPDAGEFFLEHKTSQPFEKSPVSKRDGFEIVAQDIVLTSAFGQTGQKEGQFYMVVKLGHAPFGTDDERENFRIQDITRIADIFEAFAWPTGIQACWYEREEVNKDAANWWITKMFFRMMYTGDIES